MKSLDKKRLQRARDKAVQALLRERSSAGHWEGELSSSALSAATAVTALAVWGEQASDSATQKARSNAIGLGLRWLADNQNDDGGWGDTTKSFSNISTTALGWAAFGAVKGADEEYAETVSRAREWLRGKAGGISPHKLAEAITARYGKDRTFSVPILTMCTLGGRLGKDGWRYVIQLPFELAAFPQEMFAALRLPVVSYALPALIAIGQARHHHRPTVNPIASAFRNLTRKRTLNVLRRIQPESGGYLEATPLTSFVTMSLASAGNADHPVAHSAIEFLLASMRADGSWPIDTNLATWVTTLSVNALSEQNELPLDERAQKQITNWLLGQHYKVVHPYTNAAPGGWAWTDLTGGVPDADDTPGALLALSRLAGRNQQVQTTAEMAVKWLCDLQNSDGGIPTFCKGWTNLPFDRSSPDLTAHTLRAWLVWRDHMPTDLRERIDTGIDHALT
ncbi:MAG: squalene--hopene cyclase, partial [Limisphaerales bacterium]